MEEPVMKCALGTRWNWSAYVKEGRTVYVIKAGERVYRVAREGAHWRADVLGYPMWEALNSVHYRTPEGAARAIVKLHKEYEWECTKERLTAQLGAL